MTKIRPAEQSQMRVVSAGQQALPLHLNSWTRTNPNTWHGFLFNSPDSVCPCLFRFHQFEIGENCVRGLIAVYLYSISDGRACWANDDRERDYRGVEFKVLQRANCLGVLWAMVDVLSTNHSSLFIKVGALKSPSSLVPVIICICKWWKQHFFSHSL